MNLQGKEPAAKEANIEMKSLLYGRDKKAYFEDSEAKSETEVANKEMDKLFYEGDNGDDLVTQLYFNNDTPAIKINPEEK